MGKFKLALGLHNHQPVGNFDYVFEYAHRQSYAPFLDLLKKYPSVKLSLHQSGILWAWQEKNHPEYLVHIKELIDGGQIDLLTGGFYEPILPSIPDKDKAGQIKELTDYLIKKFNFEPSGLWLTERVWEPQLPKVLNQSGVKFIPIDDTHFLYAGFNPNELTGVYVTEDQGYPLTLLPIQKRLRYLIPFGTADEIIAELRIQAERNPEGLAVYADDGEKFGVWPDTYKHCYEDGWLDNFFKVLSDNSDWLEMCTLTDASQTSSSGQAFLPSASYAEMLHWSLPAAAFIEYENLEHDLKHNGQWERYGRFVRGGHWRGFLAKYDESNLMHKRMLSVSKMLEGYELSNPSDTETISKAKHYLYAGQCNCPYWHGVFGGLYLPHIRQAIYENLINAEKLLFNAQDKVNVEIKDYDLDGKDEVIVRTNKLAAFIKPSMGGILTELDNYEQSINLTDTLRRRIEGYHGKLAHARKAGETGNDSGSISIHDLVITKEEGLDKLLVNDWYPRRCFVDHFLPPGITPEQFASGQYYDEGDFILEPFSCVGDVSNNTITLIRDGRINRDGQTHRFRMEKRYYFSPDSETISVNYCLTAKDIEIKGLRLAVENNFNFQAGHADDRYILVDGEKPDDFYLDARNEFTGRQSVVLRDDWRDMAVALSFDRENELWQVPILTVSLSEAGFEKVYQGTSLISIMNVDLAPGRPFETTILLFAGKPVNMPPRFMKPSGNVAVE